MFIIDLILINLLNLSPIPELDISERSTKLQCPFLFLSAHQSVVLPKLQPGSLGEIWRLNHFGSNNSCQLNYLRCPRFLLSHCVKIKVQLVTQIGFEKSTKPAKVLFISEGMMLRMSWDNFFAYTKTTNPENVMLLKLMGVISSLYIF